MLRTVTIALSLALPLLAAAKPLIDNEGHVFLTIKLIGGQAAEPDREIQVRSLTWGPRQSAGRSIDDMPKDLQAQDRMGDAASRGGHSMLGASDKTVLHDPAPPRDGGLGSESERSAMGRGLDIAAVDGHPVHGPGIVTLVGTLPGCRVGQRYGGMQFAASGKSYELKDVVISNCAPGEATLRYGKVTVKGWNPETKEL